MLTIHKLKNLPRTLIRPMANSQTEKYTGTRKTMNPQTQKTTGSGKQFPLTIDSEHSWTKPCKTHPTKVLTRNTLPFSSQVSINIEPLTLSSPRPSRARSLPTRHAAHARSLLVPIYSCTYYNVDDLCVLWKF
jgi:hypothetical protein